MKYRIIAFVALIMMLGMGSSVFAQSTPPDESPLDNACYAGGSLAGKCSWPTAAENEWAWTCGWYIARAELGTFSEAQVPNWCGYFTGNNGCLNLSIARFVELLIASGIDIGIDEDILDAIENLDPSELEGFLPDIKVTGPMGTLNNALIFESMNFSCTGASQPFTIVDVPGLTLNIVLDEDNHDVLVMLMDACNDALPNSTPFPIGFMYNVPVSWVGCMDSGGCGCGPMLALPDDRRFLL